MLSKPLHQQNQAAPTMENQISQTVNEMVPDSILSQIPGLNRRASMELVSTYFCNICFNKESMNQAFTLQGCDHQFCRECITEFVTNKINNGVVNMTCFHPLPIDGVDNVTCRTPITTQDIQQLVTSETWMKYQRFKANLENTLSRQCPYCEHTQIGDPDNPIMECKNTDCNQEYCLYHSNAHSVDIKCEEYELSMAKETKVNEMALAKMGKSENVKSCPNCKFVIIKSGGCNQVKCVKCGCSFCWLCSQLIEDAVIPEHYKSDNSPCKGLQFAGMEDEIQMTRLQLIASTTVLIILLIPSVVGGVLTAVIGYPIVLCCLGKDYKFFDMLMRFTIVWGLFYIVVILVPVLLVVAPIVRACKWAFRSIKRMMCGGDESEFDSQREDHEIAAK